MTKTQQRELHDYISEICEHPALKPALLCLWEAIKEAAGRCISFAAMTPDFT